MNDSAPRPDRGIEELLFHWPRVIRTAPDGWTRTFAVSVSKQSRRPGWAPSPKQLGCMRRMVSDLFTRADAQREGDDGEVIE